MLDTEREILRAAAEKGAFMSIAVNEDGHPVKGGFVPWEKTPSAFNMRTPKVAMTVEDLADPEIRAELLRCRLAGLYLFAPLEEYDSLAEFTKLEDVFICHGENVKDLNFVRDMKELFMFYLEDASLPNLKPLVEVFNEGERVPGKCLGFFHCRVEDTSDLFVANYITSELLVWPVAGDKKERWMKKGGFGTQIFYKEA